VATVGDGQGEEVGVGDLGSREDFGRVEMGGGGEADVVGPEDMTGKRGEASEDGGDRGG